MNQPRNRGDFEGIYASKARRNLRLVTVFGDFAEGQPATVIERLSSLLSPER
jgi:hypothetical protein